MGTPPKISSWTFSALSEVKLRRGARRRRRRRRRISGGEDFILDVFSPERKKVAARRAAEAAAAALALGMDADTIASLSRDDLSEGQMAWRRALSVAVSQPLAQLILQAMTHDYVQASTSVQLTTYAEQKLQISLSA